MPKPQLTNKFSSDQLHDMSGRRAGQAGMHILTSVQTLSPEEQAAGVALVFTALCRKFKRRPAELMAVATRMLDTGSKVPENGELRGIAAYVTHQL